MHVEYKTSLLYRLLDQRWSYIYGYRKRSMFHGRVGSDIMTAAARCVPFAHAHIRRRLFECGGAWWAVVVVDVGGLFAATTTSSSSSSSSSFEYKSTSSGWRSLLVGGGGSTTWADSVVVPAAVRDVRGPVLVVARRWCSWLVVEDDAAAADGGIACKCITILGLTFLLLLLLLLLFWLVKRPTPNVCKERPSVFSSRP